MSAARRSTPFRIALGQVAAAYYFLHFLVILPLVSTFETPLPLPNSITDSVLHGEAAEAAPAGQRAAPRLRGDGRLRGQAEMHASSILGFSSAWSSPASC